MGLFSAIGSLFGGGSKKKAAQKAADAQIAFAQKGLDETKRQFDLSRADQLPWLQAGQGALAEQAALLGIPIPGIISGYGGGTWNANGTQATPVDGSAAQAAAIAKLKASPLFQSLFATGNEAILGNAAATGNLRGGNTIDDLASFGRDTLSQVIQNQLANLGGISAQGGATGANLGALGANAAANMSNLFNQQGAAKAGMHLAKGGINAQNWANAGSFLDDAFSAIPGLGSFKGLF